jgi:hypothetical protein
MLFFKERRADWFPKIAVQSVGSYPGPTFLSGRSNTNHLASGNWHVHYTFPGSHNLYDRPDSKLIERADRSINSKGPLMGSLQERIDDEFRKFGDIIQGK